MIYAISDIHGNKEAFDSIMDKICLQENDTLYILGDVIDRHPDGIAMLQRIMRTPNMHLLLGNHEYMMMDALGFSYETNGSTSDMTIREKKRLWFQNGGKVTYKAWMKLSEAEKSEMKKYLQEVPLGFDLNVNGQKFKLVHATWSEIYEDFVDEEEPFPESRAFFTVWDRETVMCMADLEDTITVLGHTPTYNYTQKFPMEVYRCGNAIDIDCGAGLPHYSNNSAGRLACIRLDDLKVFYSNDAQLKI